MLGGTEFAGSASILQKCTCMVVSFINLKSFKRNSHNKERKEQDAITFPLLSLDSFQAINHHPTIFIWFFQHFFSHQVYSSQPFLVSHSPSFFQRTHPSNSQHTFIDVIMLGNLYSFNSFFLSYTLFPSTCIFQWFIYFPQKYIFYFYGFFAKGLKILPLSCQISYLFLSFKSEHFIHI